MDLHKLREIAGQLETAGIDLVARASPWLAPLPTAFLVGRATLQHLGWPIPVAAIAGATVECLGLSAVATALELRNYNLRRRKSDPKAPFTLGAALIGGYLAAALGLTVALDIAPTLAVYSPAIFPLLSLCGVTVLALRGDHKRRLEAIATDKAKRSASRSQKRSGKRSAVVQADRPETVSMETLNRANAARKVSKQEALNALLDHFERDPNASYSEVGRSVGRSKSWVSGAVAELSGAGRLSRDNGQVNVTAR